MSVQVLTGEVSSVKTKYFSRLLTTVGPDLDEETRVRLSKGPVQGLCDLSVYIKVSGRV